MRFVGDQVALVVAETEAIAAEGVRRIEVEYEDLPVVTDALDAHAPGRCAVLHPDRGTNVFGHYPHPQGRRRGRAWPRADVIVEDEYRTPAQEHAYLQPEAGLAYIDEAGPGDGRGGRAVDARGPGADRACAGPAARAGAGDLPGHRRRLRRPRGHVGPDRAGAGGLAAEAARHRRPVKIIWSREESIIGHHKRHPFVIRASWGATRDGKLIAARVEVIADGGAYAYTSTKVLGNATLMCTGPYEIPNVTVDAVRGLHQQHARAARSAASAARRAPSPPKGQMNKLAEALGMDPVEMRCATCWRRARCSRSARRSRPA